MARITVDCTGKMPFPPAPIPNMAGIRQSFPCPAVANVEETLRDELSALALPPHLAGASVAIAVGSRGIAGIAGLVRGVVGFLRAHRAEPFIVPAMGSHGQATAAGQAEVLAGYGITEENVGAPVRSDMRTVVIGRAAEGAPVHCDANAWSADGIVLINRVKPHTQFRAPIESGLLKMMAIGLGKDKGAAVIHGHGVAGLQQLIPAFGEVFLSSGKILFGVAVLENGRHRTAKIRAIRPEHMVEQEKGLLLEARELLPRLPVDTLDLLLLDLMGKDISGPGMDSNVTGRIMANGVPDPERPRIGLVAALDLTEASHGNAVGVGLADLVSERLARKIDFTATYINSIVGGFPVQGKLPMVMPSDRALLDAAALLIGATPLDKARIIHARSTLALEYVDVSEAVLGDLAGNREIEVVSPPAPMRFDADGNLLPKERP